MSHFKERPPFAAPAPPPLDESIWWFVFQDRDEEEPEDQDAAGQSPQDPEPCPPASDS